LIPALPGEGAQQLLDFVFRFHLPLRVGRENARLCP
jgi:hypothetical protein